MEWNFEILKGLPASGPMAVTFTYGPGRHTEGKVLRFSKDSEDLDWVGNFISGGYTVSAVFKLDSGTIFAVIEGGVLYLVNPEDRSLKIDPIFGILKCKIFQDKFLLLDMGGITRCISGGAVRWETHAYVPEDILDLQLEGNQLVGKAWDAQSTKNDDITLSLDSGEIQVHN